MSWLYHAKVTVIPIVKYEIKTFRAQRGVEKHKDIKIPRCSNKTCIASNFLDTVIILHTTAHIKFLDFLVQQPGNSVKCVGGITYAHAQSQFWAVKTDQ